MPDHVDKYQGGAIFIFSEMITLERISPCFARTLKR